MKNQDNFFNELKYSIDHLDRKNLESLVKGIKKIKKEKGRIFFLGVGGSAGNSSHAVNDFRKICNIESYAVCDNVSELTARTNDEGWDTVFEQYLITSKFNKKDLLFVFSVGGGNLKKNVSVNLIKAIKVAKKRSGKVLGIVGRKDGYTYKHGNVVIDVPVAETKLTTPIAEAFQAVIWHLLISHPKLAKNKTKW